ncbi:MAG: PASTA domain-containing protein [Erysipelotrichaceae bacterium]|nr:PASTA domain-containing protein [Erysipelotrichaceae bacterium]
MLNRKEGKIKKLLKGLLVFLFVFGLCACSNKQTGNTVEPVMSVSEFENIGISDMALPDQEGFNNISYAIINKNIAEVNFSYAQREYIHLASKDVANFKDILGIESESLSVSEFDVESMVFTINYYTEGFTGAWLKDGVNHVLFGKGLTGDDYNTFGNILTELNGIRIIVDDRVKVPDMKGWRVEAAEKWLTENNFVNVDIEHEYSDTVAENYVISNNIVGLAHPSDSIKVVISLGKKGPSEGDIIYVPDTMINWSEEKFVKALSELGMKAVKGSTTYFCTVVDKGNIFNYSDGNFPYGSSIKYHVSAGPYIFDSSDYDNITPDQAKAVADAYNNRNAHISISFYEEVTEKYPAGRTFDCTSGGNANNTIIACSVAKRNDKVNVPNYVGQSNPCGMGHASCQIGDLNYTVHYVIDGNTIGLVTAQNPSSGQVNKGTTIDLTVSEGGYYAHSLSSGYYNMFVDADPKITAENLQNAPEAFGHFTNVSVEYLNNDTATDFTDGGIARIYTWNNSGYWEDIKDGYYPADTAIRIQIYDTIFKYVNF